MSIDADEFQALAKLTQIEALILKYDDFPSADSRPADVKVLKNLSNLRSLEIATQGNGGSLLAFGDAILATAAQAQGCAVWRFAALTLMPTVSKPW